MRSRDQIRFIERQMIFWLAALLALLVFMYIFRSIMLPFVAGMVLAYFLDPVADWFEARGFSRLWATLTILIIFVALFALALFIIVPVIAQQLVDLVRDLPGYAAALQEWAASGNRAWVERLIGERIENLNQSIGQLLSQGAEWLGALVTSIWQGGQALLDIASLFVITPVVAFYMLLDWDRMIARIDQWLPRDHVKTVRYIARDIDAAIAGFIRGQGTLCLVLALFYAIALVLVGLNFGLLIGLTTGLISFIPYVGAIIGFILSVGVAIVQYWGIGDWQSLGLVAGIFMFGQFLEGNILQPRLVGSNIGLHPVALIFSLFAFGYLFGFVGLLIAVPTAAAIAVLVRFALQRYLDSHLYWGASRPVQSVTEAKPESEQT